MSDLAKSSVWKDLDVQKYRTFAIFILFISNQDGVGNETVESRLFRQTGAVRNEDSSNEIGLINHPRFVCLQPVFSLRVTETPELRRVFSHQKAVWQYGRVCRAHVSSHSPPHNPC